jgi:hypothetical protein
MLHPPPGGAKAGGAADADGQAHLMPRWLLGTGFTSPIAAPLSGRKLQLIPWRHSKL